VRFSFERGKSCRYSTYTYSKQLGEFWRVGEGGGGMAHPSPPKSATACYPRDVVSGVFATTTWLAGWLAVCHSRYCV